MKRIITLFLFLFAIISSYAQSVSGGLRGGINISNYSVSAGGASISPDAKVGLLLGGYLTVMSSEKFGFQPELLYSQMGAQSGSGNSSATVNFNYLSLPLLLRYNVTDNFSLNAGPQVSFLLNASGEDNSGNSEDISDDVSGTDLGGAFGFGLDFGKFNAGGRYYIGFSNVAKDDSSNSNDPKLTNNAFQLFIGYKLFGK